MAQDRYAVVGAGLAGLAAARALVAADRAVDLFEKSRGTGGRVATRRALGTTFDHGAQYFTVRDSGFSAALARPWLHDDAPTASPNFPTPFERSMRRSPSP